MKSSRPTPLWAIASLAALAACAGGGGPAPVVQTAPPPPAAPSPPPSSLDTAEYRRSNAATQVGVLPVWQAGIEGAGVTVGIVDTGIATASPEFLGRIHPASRDVTGLTRPITDEDGHGTFVAGVLAAARNGRSIVGIAPAVQLAVMRGDRQGSCATDQGCRFSDASVAAGINAASDAGARVVNISLGGSPGSSVLRQAFARAGALGTILVIGAGNGAGPEVDPMARSALESGNRDLVIVVGAATAQRDVAPSSNRAGAAAANYLLAPGERVLAFDHTGAEYLVSGTSIAAPVVSGAVALMAQAFPNLTPAQIVDLLLRTADDLGAPGPDPVYGRGFLNIARAFQPQGPTVLAVSGLPVSLAFNGTLGPALGDGESLKSALGAVPIADGYGRPYALDVGATLAPAAAGRLWPVLSAAASSPRRWGLGWGDVRLGFAAARRAERLPATADPDAHLGLAQRGLGYFSARAAQGEARLDLDLGALRLAMGTGALQPHGPDMGPGLVAVDAVSGSLPPRGLGVRAEVGSRALQAAVAHAADRGDHPAPGHVVTSLSVASGHGPVRATAVVARRKETRGLLGSRFGPALGLAGTASVELGAALDWGVGALGLRGAFRHGWHRIEARGAGLLAGGAGLRSTAASLVGQVETGVGTFHLGLAWPEALTAGRLALGQAAGGGAAALAVRAREKAIEAGLAHGPLALHLFHRLDAGNRVGLSDTGVALRLSTAF
ncbi:MAG: S8 family serine peptidase [Sphingomonadaceae bacterium]|uniref:S8 family peptidase n=1 Tax=Thermaurantiacus sp. TaxID=2820283 RepID=UPI00298F2BFC|nr:S8 family peptidase [Thermaurantiacus sp.]MCS6987398.1 S8 family serine peptidase [Sphingomonadaceae bacterium]MDW8415318.1 S8 family peptidase [Thermaurantiacus sp.]